MADRKQFQNVPDPDPELVRLLEESRSREITDEEFQEQRISFAYGNDLNSQSTKESVRENLKHFRLLR